MDKQEAVEKLIDYLDSIEVDKMFYKTRAFREMVELNIERQIREYRLENPKGMEYQSFEIEKDEQGVFISYRDYVGYYCYDFAFFFRIPTTLENAPSVQDWTPENKYGAKKRIYGWTNPWKTYDITSLVMKTSQMPYMNWRTPPF